MFGDRVAFDKGAAAPSWRRVPDRRKGPPVVQRDREEDDSDDCFGRSTPSRRRRV